MNPVLYPTVGVEEEYFLTDLDSRAVVAGASQILRQGSLLLGNRMSGEFTEYQLEAKTPPCSSLTELHDSIVAMRTATAIAASGEGLQIYASGTPLIGVRTPLPVRDDPRHDIAVGMYRAQTENAAVCGFHVHVSVPGREEAVLIGNHLRPWLPTLVALSANSPYWGQRDSGYTSWRTMAVHNLPISGPPPYFTSLEHYEQLVSRLLEAGALVDKGTLFWDVRPSAHLPTVEIRVMDVVADSGEAAIFAVLIRALVVAALERVRRGDPGPELEHSMLSAAYWRAARDGWAGYALDVENRHLIPAPQMGERLLQHLCPVLEEYGEVEQVCAVLQGLAKHGGGAERQRRAHSQRADLRDVVDYLVECTVPHTAIRSRTAVPAI